MAQVESVQCVFDGGSNKIGLGEGPHWDHKNQRLLWLDIFDRCDETKGKALHIYDPDSGSDKAIKLSEPVTSVIPRQKSDSSVVVTSKRNFSFFDIEAQKVDILKTVDDDKPQNRFNDGKCDAVGRYWAGTMGVDKLPHYFEPEKGSMYCLETGGSNVVWKYNKINLSNGIAWTSDSKKMYHVDSTSRKVFVFDFDLATGSVTNKSVAIDVDPAFGYPDGMCMDSEDKLWLAMYGSGQVIRYDPASGSIMRSVKIPALKTTSCCWGGRNLDELYVTSEGASGANPENDLLGGSLFKVTNLNCKGVPANVFDG